MEYESNDIVTIVYDNILNETDKAIQVAIDTEIVWLPKSQIEYYGNDDQYIDLPFWLVIDNNLENYIMD